MSSAAELMYKTRKELVLIRDFNQDMYMNFAENRLHDRNSWFLSSVLLRKQNEPTRVTDRTKTILDVILVSHAERYITSGNLQLGLSDHDLVFVVKKNSTPKATLYWISQHEELWQLGILDQVKKRPLGHDVLIPRCWRYLGSLERSLKTVRDSMENFSDHPNVRGIASR